MHEIREVLECSTPSGIMESVTAATVRTYYIVIVLNAFRHHGIGHPGPPNRCRSTSRCAQRLPASWNRSQRDEVFRAFTIGVLNAFRHHGIGHNKFEALNGFPQSCSTPSGIMESVTCRLEWRRHEDWECSTPSGIMESVTRLRQVGLLKPCGCSTPSGIMESVTPWLPPRCATAARAQRLPASWNRSPIFQANAGVTIPCAQRLPASWNRSQRLQDFLCGFASVLNAFRHHGIGHSRASVPISLPRCAQRLPASWNRSR